MSAAKDFPASTTLRASVVQCCTVGYDLDATLEKMERLVRVAKARDESQLAVFPEAFLGGYPKGLSFGCVVGERDPSGREDFVQYAKSAITIPGPAIARVEAISRESGVFIVSGVIERDGGTLYCSLIWVHPERGLIEKRRKLKPTASERLIWGAGDHTDVKLVTTTLPGSSEPIKISGLICWENYMPLLRNRIYELGAQLYCVSTVDSREVWQSTMQHIALEGRCFSQPNDRSYFSQIKDHVPSVKSSSGSDQPAEDPEKIQIAGGSCIIDPLGKLLAGPLRGEEGVLTATIDLDEILRGKFDLDSVGHYAADHIFTLTTRQ